MTGIVFKGFTQLGLFKCSCKGSGSNEYIPFASIQSCIQKRSYPFVCISIRNLSFLFEKKSCLSTGICPPMLLAFDNFCQSALLYASVAGFGDIPFLLKQLSNYPGTSSRVSLASCIGLCQKSLKGTNQTISADIYFLYLVEKRGTSSASKSSMFEKSALPTPTMMIESAKSDP